MYKLKVLGFYINIKKIYDRKIQISNRAKLISLIIYNYK